jgi:hypothetical protein
MIACGAQRLASDPGKLKDRPRAIIFVCIKKDVRDGMSL